MKYPYSCFSYHFWFLECSVIVFLLFLKLFMLILRLMLLVCFFLLLFFVFFFSFFFFLFFCFFFFLVYSVNPWILAPKKSSKLMNPFSPCLHIVYVYVTTRVKGPILQINFFVFWSILVFSILRKVQRSIQGGCPCIHYF